MQTMTTSTGVMFTSLFDDNASAFIALEKITNRSAFADSLITQYAARGLSASQWVWMHKIASDAQRAAQPSAFVAIADADKFRAIVDLFERARQHVKFPKVRLYVNRDVRIVLWRGGDKSRHAGCVGVAEAKRDDGLDAAFFGWILPNGTFERRNAATTPVIAKLAAFSDDPAGTAAADGRLLGACCFCGLALSDARSTAVGYGKQCAASFGLPWGVDKFVFAADRERALLGAATCNACDVIIKPGEPLYPTGYCAECHLDAVTQDERAS